ncbi:MAG: pyridoxal-phosphate dependent enzyme [Trueperaceae bacterium]
MKRLRPSVRDVWLARRRIAPVVGPSPLVVAEAASRVCGADVRLKLENLQPTGAFKVRGAANALLALHETGDLRGVVAVSTGNHGRAVAYVARKLGVPAAVYVSERVPADKLEALERSGAEVHVGGRGQDEAEVVARAEAARRGHSLVHPFDDAAVIAGQGTIGLELLDGMPDLDTALVPVSGGGLIGGIALVLKSASPDIRVVGVAMEGGSAMVASLTAGVPTAVGEVDTWADSLQGGIGLDNRFTFGLVERFVDELVLVSEDAIAHAMGFAFHHERQVLEGGGAVALAAVLSGAVDVRGQRVAVVASGGNVDPAVVARHGSGLAAAETV